MSASRARYTLRFAACLAVLGVGVVAACTSPERAFGTGPGGTGGTGGCGVAADCDDQNACTADACDGGVCAHVPAVDGPAPEQVVGDCQTAVCTNGHVWSLENNSDLPDDGNDCTTDACVVGVPAYTAVAAGTGCATNGGTMCNGEPVTPACVECLLADDCTALPPTDECQVRICTAGVCGQTFTASETPLSTQPAGDCNVAVCDGAGGIKQNIDDADLPVDGNACTSDVCTNGVPSNPNMPLDSPCGNPPVLYCDGQGSCAGCTNAGQCGAPLACQDRTCVGGQCGVANKANGTGCDDGSYCNGADSCVAGACNGHAGDPCAPNLGDADADCSESCDEGADVCTANDTAGTACSNGPGGPCKVQDSCNGGGTCVTVWQPSSMVCSPASGSGCTAAAYCTGSSASCPPNTLAPVNTYCGTTYDCPDSNCYTNDWGCDASGGCTVLLSSVLSCPILYSWDGQGFAFESDMYTSGTLGLWLGTRYRKPDPNDAYVLRQPLTERDGLLELRLVEELEEIDYLDQVRLFAVDVPADRQVVAWANNVPGSAVVLAERLVTIGQTRLPLLSAVHLESGQNVTGKLALSDGDTVVLSEDLNLPEWNTLEVDLGEVEGAPVLKMIVDGRSRYPTTQAGMDHRAQQDPGGLQTQLEVADGVGGWVAVPRSVVTLVRPKEFPRPMAIDITSVFPSGDRRMRLRWVNKTVLDAIWIDTTPNAPLTITEAPVVTASLGHHGFSFLMGGDLPVYSYAEPGQLSWPLAPGNYTRYGDVRPLLGAVDDLFAIFGPGDEVAMQFQPPPAPPADQKRFYAFASVGYYKQSNLVNGGLVPFTVAPLPFGAMSNFPYSEPEAYPSDATHQDYLTTWNTRAAP
ncbi:MAG: hypothetical protein IT373_27310 [Polyangiaceae bacterium]|nr:hypothetical protein [Polyangiaceae bacterium]